jgi:aromatic ring-opening dioxygenase LigB subunit
MVISAIFIVPHGALILDALPSHKDGRYELNKAMMQVATQISELNPDVILVTSPHGISLSDDFGIYFNESAHGTAEWEGKYQDFQVDAEIDLKFAEELYDHLVNHHLPVNKITAYSRGEPILLRWGESVPLWFLRDIPDTKFVFFSQPQKRYDPTLCFQSEATEFGKHIGNFISKHKKHVVVLISADLAHTHQQGGPYGFYEKAEKVDHLLENWIRSSDSFEITSESFDYIKQALCCGYIGFLILQGIIIDKNFSRQILARFAPTYYGMMVASFLPE